MFGLNKYGFKRKTYDDILTELKRASKDKFGEDINVSSKSIYGMFLRLISWALSLMWQLAERVYLSGFVRYAEGVNLDRIAENIGVIRRGKQRSFGEVTLYKEDDYDERIVVPAGFIVEHDNGTTYRTLSEYEIGLEDNFIDVSVISIEYGAETQANEGEVTKIVTPIDGIESVRNNSNIIGGSDEETDEELRERYYQSFGITGSSTRASIEASLRQLEGVTDVRVLENNTRETIDGLPPHYIRCIMLGGADLDIGYTILSNKAAGIGTLGDIEVTVEDDGGYKHRVYFDRAEYVDTYYRVNLVVTDKYSPLDEDKIKKSICNSVNSHKIGEDVYTSKLLMCMCDTEGVLSVDLEASLDNKNWEKVKLDIGNTQAAKCKEVSINVQQVD